MATKLVLNVTVSDNSSKQVDYRFVMIDNHLCLESSENKDAWKSMLQLDDATVYQLCHQDSIELTGLTTIILEYDNKKFITELNKYLR